ncbi:type II toxin-antitoxin system RelE/ParE family toxin [Craurococcus roseus]|uniref:Type II toxin-antitoxin system RelE/ParE family toxin n=1 Tax=Craurococcus roseus TaxID=77585 RepID=A0ABP3PN15_9PROT
MKRPVVWADSARADLRIVFRYIAGENPDAAARVAARIEDAAAGLSDFATGRAGRVSGTYEKVLPGLPYILAYEITVRAGGAEVVTILHVIHGARDWQAGEWPEG